MQSGSLLFSLAPMPSHFLISNMVETEVLIIGAGPAGLACAACLGEAGVEYRIIEKTDKVAPAWHRHYERLHLHTEKNNSKLPFVPFPKEYPKYVSRLQLIEYFNSYVKKMNIQPQFEEEVQSVMRTEWDRANHIMKWRVKTSKNEYWARFVIIATGLSHKPRIPEWEGRDRFKGEILHSSQYKNGSPYKGKRVLVVGFGNSGGEISIDLHEHGAKPCLSVRNPVNVVPKEVFGINSITLSLRTQFIPNVIFDSLTGPGGAVTIRRS